jgi:hypothetical protein
MPVSLRPGDTIRLKSKYDKYAMETMQDGESPKSFEEWLKENGYDETVFGPKKQANTQPVKTSAISY